ncbi:MAG: site-specific integrase [Victivallales bacterium]|nr:site-specific integrase [Victivallales bacterium]MBT7165521.1 site-specific integrase [Victivallales bacterium]MBT7300247.1 site-specific integrase [Victivallales bacterium]
MTAMHPLRERMIEDMQLAGLRPNTQESYAGAVRLLARHCGRSPERLGEEDVRAFFLHEINVRKLAPSTVRTHIYGVRFFYERTLGRELPILDLVRPAKRRKLPLALAHDEVKRALWSVRKAHFRTALATIYSCGLRLGEVCTLQVGHVQSALGQLRVADGKGGIDRLVPLPGRTLELLREHYRLTWPPLPWVFADKARTDHLVRATLQRVFKAAVRESGVNPAASVHTLRHSYATNLVVAGIPLPVLQKWLGHRSLQTTAVYTHLADPPPCNCLALVNELLADL